MNSLHDLHAAAGAEFQNYADLQIVSTFGAPQAEYSAVRTAAGLIDLPQRGLIEITGKDRLSFLNNLITNQTWDKHTKQGLEPGTGVYAFFLNSQGRIVCDMNVLELGNRCLLEMDARLIPTLIPALQKYIFSEQVTITAMLDSLHEFAIHGPTTPIILHEWLGISPPESPLSSSQSQINDIPIILWRDDITGAPGFNLIVSSNQAQSIWQLLLEKFSSAEEHQPAKRRLRPFGWAIYNTTRIEAGRPIFGIDFDDKILPAETGQMERAVSLTKGCYLGQEIVARMHARNQVAKKIVGIRMNEDALPMAGAPLMDSASNTAGGITSSTISPILSNACIALALVKKPFFEPGAQLRAPAEGAMRPATVTSIPFLPK